MLTGKAHMLRVRPQAAPKASVPCMPAKSALHPRSEHLAASTKQSALISNISNTLSSTKRTCNVATAAVVAVAAPTTVDGCPRGAHWEVNKFGGTCMATADRIRASAKLIIENPGSNKVVVVSAMGSHPTSPVKVTDLILNMIKRASKSDPAFLIDLAAVQEKHVTTATLLLGESKELIEFLNRLMDDVGNLKAMLQAMSIGE